MRTANPALNDNIFLRARDDASPTQETMTISGTVNRTALLLLVLTIAALWSWDYTRHAGMSPLVWGGAIGGFVVALIIAFKPKAAPYGAPVYAALEGLFLGGLSQVFEMRYPGIATQAIFLTLGILGALLLAYRSGLIKATENFKLGVVAATGGIGLMYLASIGLGFFGINIPFLHDSSPIGIGISAFIVVIAALNLVLDFDFIENGEKSGAPKHMEWYAAFGLLVTLVWLYIEILRLLAKIRDSK